ncbi:MAG: His-Xaa-Ser system radical SAM maturase HxsC [Candidatus Thiodiazotropha endolucinida]|nr:His-Xaa-Ser system radical SAM maturase HxsC [Candidatus Thiodiazotropha taylori]MCW4260197.1 His-Xaa-Ser system radical SAM maturase HxsC [Candidatus Thiodiazotropha endolucinida]
MRTISAQIRGIGERTVMQTVNLADLKQRWSPDLRYLVSVSSPEERDQLSRLVNGGVTNLAMWVTQPQLLMDEIPSVEVPMGAIEEGDVVVAISHRERIQVPDRLSDEHHTVFLTNRCNSNCLMCSQPPTRQNDNWLIDEAKAIAAHMAASPDIIGFTGGEPLLLGPRLVEVLHHFRQFHPNSHFEILTNGRLLGNGQQARALLEGLTPRVTWMVPLYGHADFLHDFVVQANGAFEETVNGLLNLQAYRQSIQLRVVLIQPVLNILPALCEFIGNNLPFVTEVALMGCEPTGFALANPDLCQVDIFDWQDQLEEGVARLEQHAIPVILMNLPHCALPSKLWPLAAQSISDWKLSYVAECEGCECKEQCSGLFMWSNDVGRKPTKLRTIFGIEKS